MSEYTPSAFVVREAYCDWETVGTPLDGVDPAEQQRRWDGRAAEFDRFLADHDAEVERRVREKIAAEIEAMESFATGANETSKAHLIGYGTARRNAARIAKGDA